MWASLKGIKKNINLTVNTEKLQHTWDAKTKKQQQVVQMGLPF